MLMYYHIVNVGFHHSHVLPPVTRFGAEKVVLVYSLRDPEYMSKKEAEKRIKESLKKAGELLKKNNVDCEKKELSGNFKRDYLTLRRIIKKGGSCVINVTGGRKITTLAMVYAAMAEFSSVAKIIYVVKGKIIELPKLVHEIDLTEGEKNVLRAVLEGYTTTSRIAVKLGKKESAVSRSLKLLERKKIIKRERKGKHTLIIPENIILG